MAQFTPSKKTIKDFNDGEEYLNRIDVVQAETINNLVEAVLYAQENGGGTTMLTEGRENGKDLQINDYFLDVIGENGAISTVSLFAKRKIVNVDRNAIKIDSQETDTSQRLVIEAQEIDERNKLKIGE